MDLLGIVKIGTCLKIKTKHKDMLISSLELFPGKQCGLCEQYVKESQMKSKFRQKRSMQCKADVYHQLGLFRGILQDPCEMLRPEEEPILDLGNLTY